MRFIQGFFPAIAALSTLLLGVASAVPHAEAFVPDAVLRVTEEERKQSCVPSKEILVVNGTSPGPALVFTEGQTVWIRVYNDIPHQNLTMVWSNQSPCARWRPISYPRSYFFLLMPSYS